MSNVKPIPEGYHTVTPYLTVQGLARLMEFLTQAFGAQETFRSTRPDGSLSHCEMRIGDSMVMLGEAGGEWKPRPSQLYLYVENVDELYHRAIAAGGKSMGEPKDQFYGDRSGGVEDPSGNYWWIATHKEDVSQDEIQKRAAAVHK